MNRHGKGLWRFSPLVFGVAFVALCVAVGLFAFKRNVIVTTLSPGDTISATFSRDYQLRSYVSTVKIAGVVVGTVTDITHTSTGTSRVDLKLDRGTPAKLGTAPSAAIRPSTMLGGVYYVDLVPGGDPGRFTGDIPVNRTRIAVELDSVVQSLQPQARAGSRQFIDKVDQVLQQDGRPALQALMHDAPATLAAAGPTFDALAGDRPDTLTDLVRGLDNTARVLNRQNGQLQSILTNLNDTTNVLDQEKQPLENTIAELPDTLRTTRTGMTALRGSLDRLTSTAPEMQPTAQALNPLLTRAEPVLRKARPVVRELRDVLRDARPLVDQLIPTSDKITDVLDHLRGPVMSNINGPILNAVNTPWRGVGRYAGNGSKYKLYQDVAYMVTNANAATKYTDKNGAGMTIQVGQGIDDISDLKGLPNFEQFVRGLLGPKEGPR